MRVNRRVLRWIAIGCYYSSQSKTEYAKAVIRFGGKEKKRN